MTRIAVAQLAGRPIEEAARSLHACEELVGAAARAGAEVVVLPEGSYPAYVVGTVAAAREALAAGPDPVAAFGALARTHRLTLVVGLVLDEPGGLRNAAVVFGPDGEVLGRTPKRFLWHFDHCWFAPGDDSPVWSSPHARLGALVCADARLFEIARSMAVQGAALVCDPTAWVTARPQTPTNIQPEFLVSARAIENGVVLACASKCGFEGDTVAYVGRSMIVGPDGTVLAEASVEDEEVVVADVDLEGLPAPPVARRRELYGALTDPCAGGSTAPTRTRVRVAAANGPDAAELLRLGALRGQGVELLALGATDHPDPAAVARALHLWVAAPGRLDGPGGEHHHFPPVHGPAADTGITAIPGPVATPVGRIAVLGAHDALVPEHARVVALAGAEILVVTGDVPIAVLRTRAAEHRVFVVAAGHPTVVVGPSGAVLADAPPAEARPFVASADLFLPEAAHKEMAPGTDTFAGRQPTTYGVLVAPTGAEES